MLIGISEIFASIAGEPVNAGGIWACLYHTLQCPGAGGGVGGCGLEHVLVNRSPQAEAALSCANPVFPKIFS